MRFKSRNKIQPELVAAKDPMRPVLNTAHLNTDTSEVWVTDSYMLARFPVELEEGDTAGMIPVEALKAQRKANGRSNLFGLSVNGEVSLTTPEGVQSWKRPEGQFPNLAQLVPDDLSDFEIGLDAKKLYDLARAMGDERVRIRFTNGPGSASPSNMRPFIVTPLGNTEGAPDGPLMPIRVN